MSEAFDARMTEWREQIDDCIATAVADSRYSDKFKEILNYALFPGGKRLRPILFLEWHSLYAPPDKNALLFASAIEIVHAYSLIHDDMPCMDNSDTRRGKPSVHKAFGEGKALLAGDALLTLAFKCMSESMDHDHQVMTYVASQLCGDSGIIEGQYLDLYSDCGTLSELLDCYAKKTAALITLACAAGYVFPQLSGAGSYEFEGALGGISADCIDGTEDMAQFVGNREARVLGATSFGNAFGTAFQIYDDLSEYISGEKPDGKNILDFVSFDDAKKLLNRYLNKAIFELEKVGGDTSTLSELTRKFVIA